MPGFLIVSNVAINEKISEIQGWLEQQHVGGWLLYDNHGSNRFARTLLSVAPNKVLTRRFFYWIPTKGEPQKIVHRIEEDALDQMPGGNNVYLSWKELENTLKTILSPAQLILMEYSPRACNPHISVVDAGTTELIKTFGIEILS